MKIEIEEAVTPTGDGASEERQDWRTLRKLDAEIAERVMGWTRYPKAMHPTDNRTIEGILYCPPKMPWDSNALNVVPAYSTDIAAAMQVVEKFIDTGGRVSLRGMRCVIEGFADEYKPLWRVNFYRFRRDVPPGTRFSFDSEAASLPEAICRAALALVDGPTTNEVK